MISRRELLRSAPLAIIGLIGACTRRPDVSVAEPKNMEATALDGILKPEDLAGDRQPLTIHEAREISLADKCPSFKSIQVPDGLEANLIELHAGGSLVEVIVPHTLLIQYGVSSIAATRYYLDNSTEIDAGPAYASLENICNQTPGSIKLYLEITPTEWHNRSDLINFEPLSPSGQRLPREINIWLNRGIHGLEQTIDPEDPSTLKFKIGRRPDIIFDFNFNLPPQ